jgi:alkylhydroperoxidase/carboxymuconolactone decarboxylase family protein YurZ
MQNQNKFIDRADPFLSRFESLDREFRLGSLGRLQIDKQTRSMLALSMVAGKIQTEWVPEHVVACVDAGLGRTEIAEVLMQVYCYAGIYASMSSFRAAAATLSALESEGRLTPRQSVTEDRQPSTTTYAERVARGFELRREIFGASNVDGILRDDDEFMQMFNDLTHDFCFGNIWDRPALTWPMRSQLCLAIASSTGQTGAVERHVRSAVRNGVIRQCIADIFVLAYAYGGAGYSLSSFEAAKKVFAQLDAET